MATKNMAYDHAAYITPYIMPGEIAAAVSSKSSRFAAFTAMTLKSTNISVITAGGTVNVVQVIRQAAGGTALTTLALCTNIIGTNVGGYTTNILTTGTNAIVQGDILWAEKGSADGVGVYAIGFEMVVVPGSSITA